MIQNKNEPTKIGRPRQFDSSAALSAATEVFWLKGYDAASLDDLTSAMNINRPSLYLAFKDKQSLFFSALEAYASSYGTAPLLAFQASTDPVAAVKIYFTTLVRNQARAGDCAKGCLLASCATGNAGQLRGVKEFLVDVTAHTITELVNRFEMFKQTGLLSNDFASKTKASLMVDITHGFAYRARCGESLDALLADVEDKTAQVLGR
jgi:AcrR family transcriptional regulator